MKKIGLDLGNSSMKIVAGEKDQLIYRRIRSLATLKSEDNNHVVDMGQSVHFGVGSPLIEQDKTDRKYLEESILLAVYESYGAGAHEIALGLTLPINLYKLSKEPFKAQIEAMNVLKGKVNGLEVQAELKKVNIQAEGLAAFYALMPEIPKGPILFIDLGHRTTDMIAANIDSENGKWRLEGSESLQCGGYELLNDLQNALYPKTKTFFSTQQIEQIMAAGGKVGRLQIESLYKEALSERVADMEKAIHQLFNDLYFREVYLCGGAAPLFAACYDKDNLTVLKDNKMMYSNAVGSYLKL